MLARHPSVVSWASVLLALFSGLVISTQTLAWLVRDEPYVNAAPIAVPIGLAGFVIVYITYLFRLRRRLAIACAWLFTGSTVLGAGLWVIAFLIYLAGPDPY